MRRTLVALAAALALAGCSASQPSHHPKRASASSSPSASPSDDDGRADTVGQDGVLLIQSGPAPDGGFLDTDSFTASGTWGIHYTFHDCGPTVEGSTKGLFSITVKPADDVGNIVVDKLARRGDDMWFGGQAGTYSLVVHTTCEWSVYVREISA